MSSRSAVDREIVALARIHGGLIPHATLLQTHVDTETIARRHRSGLLTPVLRGVSLLSSTGEVTVHHRAVAAALAVSGAVVSHRSAALLRGAPIGDVFLSDISMEADTRARLPGVRSFRSVSPFELGDTSWLSGVRVSAPSRNVLELGAVCDIDRLEVVLDYYLQQRATTLLRVRRTLERWRGGRNIRALTNLLNDREHGSGMVRSWLEGQAVRVLGRAGIEPPVRNYSIRLPNGRRRTLDLAWPALRVVVEVESWAHHSNPGDWGRTRTRDRDLQMAGWIVVPCVVADTRRPDAFLAALRAALDTARAAAVRPTGQLPQGNAR